MDWSSLPSELLQEIYPKLASVVEFIRFRAVCRSWRSVAIPADLPSQLPWLLLPHDPSTDARPFLCLSTGATHVLRLPTTRNKRICGSGHGWLILFDESTTVVSLLNPLTGSLISLPPVDMLAYYLISASLSDSPTSAGGCVVAIQARCTSTMAFCWVLPGGSSRWTSLRMNIKYWVTAVAYHRGRLCVTNGTGMDSLYIWETTPKTLLVPADFTVEVPSPGEDWTPVHCRLVDSEQRLLLVAAYRRDGGPIDCSMAYTLDEETWQPVRVESQSIGDGVRSYDNDPFVTVSTGEYVACRERLYFARLGVADGVTNADGMLKVLDLNNHGVEELLFESGYMPGFVKDVTWLVPSLM